MLIIVPAGLKKDVKDNLKNSNYTQEEFKSMYQSILTENEKRKKGFKLVSLILVFTMVLFTIISISTMMKNNILIFIVFFNATVVISIIFAIKYLYVDRIKIQFIKYSKLGGYTV
ncbi:hypothetical protein [Peptostreptococcus faecalis]|uniref:hypothetical protein n=1 Tax=Peptostreptococcus faecalis TaxID=2045015 RepID=UPI000C7AA09A|nr:hypothetical protein [Peptostreptococcus faecalis]